MIGQGNIPEDNHPLPSSLTNKKITDLIASLNTLINRTVEKIPSHDEYLRSLT